MKLLVLNVVALPPLTVEALDSSDFCMRRVATKTCPTPPTIDTIDLHTFLGSYYEVGTTARYKLRSEGGLVCMRSNFSMDTPPEAQANVVTIDVQNTGLQVVGIESVSAFSKISYSAADVCANAARMCAMMDTSSKLSEALVRIGTVSNDIAFSSPMDLKPLNHAAAIINSSVANVYRKADALALTVTVISRIAAELSQGVGPYDTLLRALRSTVTSGSNEVRELGSNVIGNLTYTRNLIAQVITHRTNPSHVELLSEASTLIEQEIELLISQVSRIQGLLSSIGGPLADTLEADASLTNQTKNIVVTKGQVIQTTGERGNMVLSIKQTIRPYKIIALEGFPLLGYSSLLVYSCELDSNGDPVEDVFLLSSSPSIPAPIVNILLNLASTYGISMDCDSVFVPTVQTTGDCGLLPH
ncbi:hypothetical protein KP509_17G017000 [Ceratopteris richardii]|nr:hypothetical protein KP509_17G017000 [Ceratopteris richardii]